MDTLTIVRLPTSWPQIEWEIRNPNGVAAYLKARDGDSVSISHIGVDPQNRRRGLASRLLTAFLAEYGNAVIELVAAPFPSWREPGLTHDDLKHWYARHGFKPAPRRGNPDRMRRITAAGLHTTEK
ncbi:GNAT superfamily N-acetyltransferase [Streptomyces ambofaciens]